jgi:hypothetical protein
MKKKKEINNDIKKEKKEVVFITSELKQSKLSNEEYNKVKGFIVLVVIIGIFVGLLFFLNGNFVTKDLKEDETTTTTTEAEYDSKLILASEFLNLSDKSYYVLFYDADNTDEKAFAEEFINKYNVSAVPLYKVELNDLMNKKYYDPNGTENTKPKNSDELVITKTTLIKVNKKKVSSFITDKNEIGKLLSEEETTTTTTKKK